jgi:hypothetical protein
MSTSTSHKRGSHSRGAHGGHGGGGGEGGGGGGGGGGGEGPLVKVGFARNQAEAEMLQGLLRDGGIPSILKRSRGFDNPDFLASGPHDIFVVSDLSGKARDILAETVTEPVADEETELHEQARLERDGTDTPARRLAIWVGVAFVAAVVLVWLLYQLS